MVYGLLVLVALVLVGFHVFRQVAGDARRTEPAEGQTREPWKAQLGGVPPFSRQQFDLLLAILERFAQRHDQINTWRHQIVAAVLVIYSAVMAGVVTLGKRNEPELKLLGFALFAIGLAGLFLCLRLAVTRVYAADVVSKRRELVYYVSEKLLPQGAPYEVAELEPFLKPGSHFFSDMIVAVLNSAVLAMACRTMWPEVLEPPALLSGVAIVLFLLHFWIYRARVLAAARPLCAQRVHGGSETE